MKLISAFWRYWKWLCVALMTSFVVLAILAALIASFKLDPIDKTPIERCIDSGGSWDAGEGVCKNAA